MTRETLLALADRVEALTGPCRTADRDIFKALFPDKVPSPVVESGYGWREDDAGWWMATGEDARVPPRTVYPQRYTASIDAAVTLVPDGFDWVLGRTNGGLTIHAEVGGRGDEFMRFGESAAIALTAAALRARAEALS